MALPWKKILWAPLLENEFNPEKSWKLKLKALEFFSEFPRTRKVPEIEFDPGKSWNFVVVQIREHMHGTGLRLLSSLRCKCINECTKYWF